MEVIIKGEAKEIAELATELQDRLKQISVDSVVNLDEDFISQAFEQAIRGKVSVIPK